MPRSFPSGPPPRFSSLRSLHVNAEPTLAGLGPGAPPEAVGDKDPLRPRSDEGVDESVRGAQVLRILEHRDLVYDVRLCGLADGDREHFAADGAHVRDVDE